MRGAEPQTFSKEGGDSPGAAAPADSVAYLDWLDAALINPLAREGFRYWRGLLGDRRFPTKGELEPTQIPRNLNQITLIDVTRDPLRFRVRLLGFHNRQNQGIRAHTDMSEVKPEQGRDRILARLALVVEERRPVRGVYSYKKLAGGGQDAWAEVISCPLSEDGESVTGIVSFGSEFDQPPPGAREWP